MDNVDLGRMIRQIIRSEITPILMGKVVSTQSNLRATTQRFTAESEIPNVRLISPYGITSRPKPGTDCVVMPVFGDATNLQIVGQFDSERPPIDDGEACLYGPDGQVVYMKNGGSIHQGTLAAAEPVVLGNVLKEFLTNFINLLIESPQIGYDSFGLPVVIDPEVALQLLAWRIQYLDTPTTNIVGQKNFVERGI